MFDWTQTVWKRIRADRGVWIATIAAGAGLPIYVAPSRFQPVPFSFVAGLATYVVADAAAETLLMKRSNSGSGLRRYYDC